MFRIYSKQAYKLAIFSLLLIIQLIKLIIMTYFDFLFSQLFMVQLNKYCYIDYDTVFDDIKFYIDEYHNSEYSEQNKSEYECINDFLNTIILPYVTFSKEYLQLNNLKTY